MMAVVACRPGLEAHRGDLQRVRELAESCAKQLTGWAGAVKDLPFEGPRHMPKPVRQAREVERKATEYRLRFLRGLKPEHPLYNSPEAREARGAPPGE